MLGNPIVFDFRSNAPSGTSMGFVQVGLSLTVFTALNYGGNGSQIPYEFSTPTLSMSSQGIAGLNNYGDREPGFDADGKYEITTLSFG